MTNSKLDDSQTKCLKQCDGLIITSFIKSEIKADLREQLGNTYEQYKAYIGYKQFPFYLKGFSGYQYGQSFKRCYFILEYQWEPKLHYVRIYFDTPTFDRITKDRSAKFVDMLSAIGGTMGLLTGFSIISGVEIVYFVVKYIIHLFKMNK